MNTRLLLPSPPRTSSRSSNDSLTPLSPRTTMTMSLPRSPSPVDWTITNQWWCGHLPPPSLCPTQSTSQTTPLCVPTTQRYAFPAPREDLTARNLINHDAQHAARSAKSQAAPPINVSAGRKQKLKPDPNTSHREMRPSTTWGQYIRTQGGRLRDSAYPASAGRRWVQKKKMTRTAATMTTINTTRIPSQFQRWDVQLQRTKELIEIGRAHV